VVCQKEAVPLQTQIFSRKRSAWSRRAPGLCAPSFDQISTLARRGRRGRDIVLRDAAMRLVPHIRHLDVLLTSRDSCFLLTDMTITCRYQMDNKLEPQTEHRAAANRIDLEDGACSSVASQGSLNWKMQSWTSRPSLRLGSASSSSLWG
jgi:hypothetical protein